VQGNLLEGTAEGFLARVIQHEIDHLRGVLFIDYVDKQDLLSFDEYRERRKKAMEVLSGE
jgi:peptide deformylase